MPSVSKKQHNFMEAVAHNAAFAKKVGIPQSVGQEFSKADKGKKFGSGGRADLQKINRPSTSHGRQALFKEGGYMKIKETMGPRTMSMDVEKGSNKKMKFGESAVQKRGHTKGKNLGDSGPTAPIQGMKKGGMKKMAGGGLASGHKSADGIASKGKTKARQVTMKSGGKAYC